MKIRLNRVILSQIGLASAGKHSPKLKLPKNLNAPCEIAKVLFKKQFPNINKKQLKKHKKRTCGTFFWQGVLLNYVQNSGRIVLPVKPISLAAPYPCAEVPDYIFEIIGYIPEIKAEKSSQILKKPLGPDAIIPLPPLPPRKNKTANDCYSKKNAQALYESDAWRRLRYTVLREQNGCCQLCGRSRKDGVILHVDHIVPLSKDWSKRLDPTNLQVLCADCNLGKSNTDEIDWR
jgi:hypothetical protein